MFYLAQDDFAIAGASPEMLIRVADGEVSIHPIAGTRRRAADPERDTELARELLADEKERAEHVMLVDLGRNDVGRVCRAWQRQGDAVSRCGAILPRDAPGLARHWTAALPIRRPTTRCEQDSPPAHSPARRK